MEAKQIIIASICTIALILTVIKKRKKGIKYV